MYQISRCFSTQGWVIAPGHSNGRYQVRLVVANQLGDAWAAIAGKRDKEVYDNQWTRPNELQFGAFL
jgi:hypothetical protein